MNTHPLMLCYKETLASTHPLIMVIGREPNNSTTSDGSLGNYDFKDYPRCAFWNVAFSVFGKCNHQNVRQVKDLFISKSSSPIVFTDALSTGIANSTLNKKSIRERSIHSQVDTQLENIFSHNEIIQRTKLMILSGLESSVYDTFKAGLKKIIVSTPIQLIETRFFYPTNTGKIMNQLSEENLSIIRDVYEKFCDQPIHCLATKVALKRDVDIYLLKANLVDK